MELFSADGSRPLSPITERTTPGSFRTTIGLPTVDVVDYQSEREDGASSPAQIVYSRQSSDTITQQREVPVSDIEGDLSKKLDDDRPISQSHSHESSIKRLQPFPDLARPISELTAMPRMRIPEKKGAADEMVEGLSAEEQARQRYMDRYFPKADEEDTGGIVLRGVDIKPEEGHDAGMAGVGANGSARGKARSRPSSFHAGTPTSTAPVPGELAFLHPLLQPGGLPPRISSDLEHHPEFHNIPFVPEHHAEIWSNPGSGKSSPIKLDSRSPVRSPATSRPSSIRQRPHSFDGSQSGSKKQLSKVESPAAVIDAVVPQPFAQAIPPATSERPSLISHHSDISLPRSHSSGSLSKGRLHRKTSPPRRRIVSSIFGSIFGSSPKEPDTTPRKLSRRRPVSQSEEKPIVRLDSPTPEHPIDGLNIVEPVTAIRTSGTFGIRDDGSELYTQGDDPDRFGSPGSPRPRSIRNRSQSGSGSIQSLGAQRVLFVKNVDDTVIEDDEGTPIRAAMPSSPVEEVLTEESVETREAFYTPVDIGSPASSHHDLFVDTLKSAHGMNLTSTGPSFVPGRSLSPAGAQSPTFASAGQTLRQKPVTPSPTQPIPAVPVLGVPFSIPRQPRPQFESSASIFPNPNIGGDKVVDAFSQTSPSIGASPWRPLPPPPGIGSRRSSIINETLEDAQNSTRVGVAQDDRTSSRRLDPPMLNIPSPPLGSPSPRLSPQETPHIAHPTPVEGTPSIHGPRPTSDLPLLIASHLLSTHAAALMRHSATMRDVSEVMHQMAQESLEWGGILLGMSQTGKEQVPPPSTVPQSSVGPFSQSHPALPRDSGIEGLPGRSYEPAGYPDDPLKQALEKLSGLGISTSAAQSEQSVHHLFSAPLVSDTKPTTSEESDRFTPIPQRPTASRKSSRNRLTPERSPAKDLRSRPESLPADWLEEADRLGREGWESLRKAEEAWSSAMTSLKALAEPSPTTITTDGDISSGRDTREDEPTLKARPLTRSRHASLDMPFPRKMERAGRMIVEQQSFLPTDLDMRDMSSEQIHTGDLDKAAKILGPNVGLERFKEDRARKATNPVYATLIQYEQEGYSNEHLGLDNSATIKDRPKSRADTSTVSTATAGRTGGRKLSKRTRPKETPPPIPSRFMVAHTSQQGLRSEVKGEMQPVQMEGSHLQGTQKKKHWWSRRRAGSLVG